MSLDNPFAALPLLSFNDYLSLIRGGIQQVGPGDADKPCLDAAQSIWEHTGLQPWSALPRMVQMRGESNDGRFLLAYVNADRENCYLIVLFDKEKAAPVAHLLHDLAQYRKPVYYCPYADHDGPADEDLIQNTLPHLMEKDDPFAILEIGPDSYMQTYQDGVDDYQLEYQQVTTSYHFRAVGTVTAAQAIAAFKSYGLGNNEWAGQFKWERIAPEAAAEA